MHAATGHPRRAVLRAALLGTSGALLSACSDSPTTAPASESPSPSVGGASRGAAPSSSKRVLLAYFSRPGENYFNGGRRWLTVGNTEVVAGLIGRLIQCDVHRIEAADPYPEAYDPTVSRNVREQEADARPAIANPLRSIDDYDTIILGSPIWNVRAPMIMTTFVERFDFAGKTVHPLTTYAMSGLGTTERDYAASCRGAVLGDGLAVRGEEVNDAEPAVADWLTRTGLT